SRAPKKKNQPCVVIPLSGGAQSTPARESELIEVAKNYQAIASASERALVRKLLKRLSMDSRRAGACAS
ncbi:MAG TPA: hypothetical protein VNH64_00475, partial [Parvularculaceae bacterium]|nr:hypothetical protein [Parvularculaceae bacterium]